MATALLGWEPLHKSVLPQLKDKKDLIVLFVHWNLVKNNVRCLGSGEEMTMNEGETGSELLPDDWNTTEKYSLRYVHNDELYLFFVTFIGDRAIFNLLKCSGSKLCSFAVDTNEEVKALTGKLPDMIPNYEHLIFKLRKELMETIENKTTTDASVQTEAEKREIRQTQVIYDPVPDPLRVYRNDERNLHFPGSVYPGYGAGDLQPGGFGGGNLFDPRIPRGGGRIPHRFDPINPPCMPFPGPNPDHFLPPQGPNAIVSADEPVSTVTSTRI